MSLSNLLQISSDKKKIGISKERIDHIKPHIRNYIAFWREYPDLFVDFMQTGGDPEKAKSLTFRLFSYQRVFLRVGMRYKYVYVVYPRAYSKSFLSVLILMIQCILYPESHLFSTAGGKEQAASILQEKVDDICNKIPAFKREIDWGKGSGTTTSKDHCRYVFKNGSDFENVAARESSRGRRKHKGLIEECVGVDQKMLQEVLIPMMNVSRRALDGTVHEEEVLSQGQLYITTAGYKNTFSYEKLIQTLIQMITEPGKAFVMGGSYRIPVLMGLLPKNFVSDLKRDPTFNEASFEREYCSGWTGIVADAFFSGEKFDRNRILQKPEYEASGRANALSYYVVSADVGRTDDLTVVTVIKVTPQPQGVSLKNIVNIIPLEKMHFEDQAIKIKDIFNAYHARRLVIDGNGLGIGLVDYLVKPQYSSKGRMIHPDFGVYNDPDGKYRQFRTEYTYYDAIYIIKANTAINSEAYSTLQSQMDTGRVKFLIESRLAKAKLLGTKLGQNMTPEQRADYLLPYTMTDILREEILNLREESEGANIILKRANSRIKKDKVSSLVYGLYYIREEEDGKKKKRNYNIADMLFCS